MSDTAATIITAIAGGLFALGAAYIGYRGGRRQTADQAQVEHQQWLRGQRQEAYVQFLEYWEKALALYADMEEYWHEDWIYVHPDYEGDPTDDMAQTIGEAAQKPINDLRPFLERVIILGPTTVEKTARELNTTLIELRQQIGQQIPGFGPPDATWGEFHRLMSWAPEQRQMFVKAARDVMRAAPRPGEG